MGPNASYTLYAQWTAKTNVVKFDGNDADVGQFMPNQEIPVDVTMKLNKNTLKRNGYRFAGWSYQKLPVNSYNWDLPDEAQVQMPVDGIQLYAVWFSNANRIVFHSNDSSNGSYEIERGTGSSGVLPVCEFKRDGYNFLGWATSPNGAATVFGDTQYVMGSNPEYHLYAVWDPVLNTVIFDRNGADGGQNMPVKQMYTGERDYLFSNTYEKTNYIFLGWDRNATAKIPEYSNGYFYTMGAKSVTLYAIWEIEVLKITFYSNGSTDGINSVVQNFDSGETKNLSPNTFVRDGYTFAGWGTTAVSTEIAYPDGGEFTMTGSVRNPVMYAVWTPNLNKILFNGNGNTNDVSMIDQEVKTGAYAYLRPNLFVKINYVFMGWAKTPAATAAEFADKEYYLMGQNATYTLYAVWSQIQNRITFNANGGTGTMSEQIIGQGSKAALNANAFSRIGYDFTGWAISPGGSKAYDDAAQYAMGTSASTVLYAKWKIQTYTVSFDGAGGKTGDGKSVVSVSADYGTVIKPPEFIRPGFKVDGYVDQNGNPADLSSASGSANLKPKWAFDEGVITITVKNPDSSAGNGYQSLKVTDLVPIDNVVYLFQWYALESGSWKAMQGETSDTLIVGADKDPANYRAMVTVVFTDGSGADGDYNIENYVDSKGKPISGGGSSGVSILRPGFSGNQSIIIAVAVVLGVIILIVIIALVAGAVSKERKRREAEEQNAYWQ
jgi:uncharacterized repeat protein (TIGR02543 family)